MNVQHPARIWVERQENKSVGNEPERLPTTSECGHHPLQIVKGLKQGTEVAAEDVGGNHPLELALRALRMITLLRNIHSKV